MVLNFIIRMVLTVGIFVLVDLYSYQAIKQVFGKRNTVKWGYWGLHVIVYIALALFISSFVFGWQIPRVYFYWFLTIAITLFLPKLIICIFLLLEDAGRLFRFVAGKLQKPTPSQPEEAAKPASGGNKISRAKFISQSATVLAGIPFTGMVYGILKGRYNFTLHKIQVPVVNLPEAFRGLTFTQISDVHVGSFDNRDAVLRGIDLINSQESDYVFFTGDLINNHIDELNGYEDIFSQVKARRGVFSTLGNHDYGDYDRWSSDEEKKAHFQKVIKAHGDMGWNLLKNQNHIHQEGEDKLAIIGVENWGGHGFTKYGKLDQAIKGAEDAQVKILLSHDPSHWNEQVLKDYKDINLTLSGHTHGMQFGVEVPSLGIKWSPAQFRYEQWAGLYPNKDQSQHLYVNRGFGHLAFMGRTGIMPEVTVFELVPA